jgi:dihydroorotase
MPAFVDLHAHFRDPGFPEKETLESAALAAAAGGYGTVVCMANTKPVTDTVEKALALKKRSDNLGLIDLYPVLSLTKNMEGRELSEISALDAKQNTVRMLSEDGKDVADDGIFLAAFAEARRLGIPVSCHCDAGGPEAEAAKKAGKTRDVWSRIEENVATKRAIELGKKSGCPCTHRPCLHERGRRYDPRSQESFINLRGHAAPHRPYGRRCPCTWG